jgi:hypothetical protein
MTTSGVKTFDPVRDIVIKGALRLVGAFPSTGLPRPEQIEDAQNVLNMMIKAWQTQGFLWVKEYGTIFLEQGRTTYCLPAPGDTWAATCYSTLELETAQVATDTVILSTDTSGFTVGDSYGIMTDTWQLSWGLIASIDTNVSITLDTVLSGDAALGNIVYHYTAANALYRPTRIFHSSRLQLSGSEVPLISMSRDDYNDLTTKLTQSTPVQYYFDPQLAVAKLNVWPTAQDSRDRMVVDVDRPLEVMLDPSNTYDFPQEWMEVIKYGLAVRLAPEYAVPMNERTDIKGTFNSLAENILAYNMDFTPAFIGVDFNG